jgi:hypothetical protein
MKHLAITLTALAILLCCLPLVAAQNTPTATRASYAPDVETLLLENGYTANIIQVGTRRGLRASQLNYTNSVWSRDLDYAISGYAYVLDDMTVLRENIELFLLRVEPDGIAPETIYLREGRLDHENRRSWDSMPNLVHAVYVYVAKTGDVDFYRTHRDTLLRIGDWIAGLDEDGDGLPDSDEFPYGYYDSIANSTRHTYAIARFYGAYHELAELEAFAGEDGSLWSERAATMRASYHRPAAEGGYWLEEQPWPLAFWRPNDQPVTTLETFGVFSALRSGLIGPQDGTRYTELLAALHVLLPDLSAGPSPMRLALGGFDPDLRREVDPPVPLWMMDASAPWIVGQAAPAYAAAGFASDARDLLRDYMTMARSTDPPVLEFAAGETACFGPGNSGDGGRTWDSAAWFLAVYGGHYGLTMTPGALVVQPAPFQDIPNDSVQNLVYQGATIQLALDADARTYRLSSDQPVSVVLRPMGNDSRLSLNDSTPTSVITTTLQAGRTYDVESSGSRPVPSSDELPPRDSTLLYNCAPFRAVWSRTDLPVAEEVLGAQPRTWVWGPEPITGAFHEPYAEGVGGSRLVHYYDKSRMEINDPDAPPSRSAVTNGLLVVEMITGEIQVGDNSFEVSTPAQIAVAGDPAGDNPSAPTYRSFRSVAYPVNDERAPNREGEVVTERLARDGTVSDDPSLGQYSVRIGSYSSELGHNVPQVFVDFFTQEGLVYEDGDYTTGTVIDPSFVVGLPISEPYWARVRVGGVEKDVLIQAFERRVLTFTPSNLYPWRVEMGNVGRHYLAWRYGE